MRKFNFFNQVIPVSFTLFLFYALGILMAKPNKKFYERRHNYSPFNGAHKNEPLPFTCARSAFFFPSLAFGADKKSCKLNI